MDHSGLYTKNKIFKLDGIWADVVFTNQKAIKINKDGSSSVIKSNSE